MPNFNRLGTPGNLLLLLTTMLLLAVSLAAAASARLLHSVPEDPYSFPKFRVAFLNGLPVLNETAQRWLNEGLRGGELEFLDQPWKDHTTPSHLKEIGTGDEPASFSSDVCLRVPKSHFSRS